MRSRSPVPDDAGEVLAVLNARDAADLGAPDFTLEDLEDEWSESEFQLGYDARVIETSQGIIGYAGLRRTGVLAAVDPAAERRGVGGRLLRWAEQREREIHRELHRQWVAAANHRGRLLLSSAGYRRVRSFWRMAGSLQELVNVPDLPSGIRMRALDVERDAKTLHELDESSFAANADFEPHTFAAFRGEHLEAHDLDPALSLVAEHDDLVIGFLLARRWQQEAVGYVDLLAVDPEHRGRGVGGALLGIAFSGFAGAGLRTAELGVASDNTRALALYERAGLQARFRVDTFERRSRATP